MNSEIENTLIRFLNYFEKVFDSDWEYSKEMMGICSETETQKKNAQELELGTIEMISNQGTFLNPKVDDENEDWGYRGALLREYRTLKKIINQ